MDLVTDGEMRRDVFFGFFINGMEGVVPGKGAQVKFHNNEGEADWEVEIPFVVTSKVQPLPCPGVDEYTYAAARTDLPVKVTLPSALMALAPYGEESRDVYPEPLDLVRDAGEIVKGWVRELAAAGCTHIQMDAPEINEILLMESIRDAWREQGVDPDELLDLGIQILKEIGELDLPGVQRSIHVCKGNGTQAWIAEGGYEPFADRVFPSLSGFDVFHFEFDDSRSGGFEPIKLLPDDKVAVLGLVSTKWVTLEDPDELRARIDEASKFHPLDRLALAPQCGFASAGEDAEGRMLTENTQRDKLKLVADIAHSVWS
jgi:5-methyltetrahydropteroyltriglutamate--homocysteine methyltransferase